MKWDYKIDDPIDYFDREKSYELTKYRVIDDTNGLDFNPDWFREDAINKLKTGRYSPSSIPIGSKTHRDWWKERIKRCNEGYESHGYRVTGDNYFFLNFYNLKSSDNDTINQTYGFPQFFVFQYEYFHYLELCEKLKKDTSTLKSRGIGWSEIASSSTARPYTTIPNFRTVISAFSEKHLNPTLSKIWLQLDWLNENTEGAMRRARMVINTKTHKRASKKDKSGGETPDSHKAEIEGLVCDDPDKLRGDRTQLLIYEECFGEGTEVRMFDLSIKNIEDIIVGDELLGPKGEKQIVSEIHCGIDEMYEINQKRGMTYTTTANHPLYVESRPRMGGIKDQIKLMTPLEYMKLSDYSKRTTYGLQSGCIEFNDQTKDFKIDPYYLGLWLGDGVSASNAIVVNRNCDPEIENFLLDYAKEIGCVIKYHENNSPSKYVIKNLYFNSDCKTNFLNSELRKYNLINNKHLPKEIYYLPQEQRLQVLAGLIDSDGNLKKGTESFSFSYEIAMGREWLIDEITLLARLCGFDVKRDNRKNKTGYKIDSPNYRVIIKGNICQIPVKVERKKVPIEHKKTNKVNSTGVDIKSIGKNKYYGIKLKSLGNNHESNNLFLLKDFTIVHNCGADPVLIKKWVKGTALITVLGGKRVGRKLAFGTGGSSKESSMEGLKKMTYDPQAYNILPVRHNFTEDKEYIITGMFIPAYRIVYELADKRGWCNREKATQYYLKEREKLANNPKDLLDYKSEYCFTIEEALIQTSEVFFPREELAEQEAAIEIHKTVQKPITGSLVWKRDDKDNILGVKWRYEEDGKILIKEPPLISENGSEYKNLYVGGIDSIDIGKGDSADSGGSDFCIVIKKRIFGQSDPCYVAIYKDRPRDVREAYDTAAKLLTYYGCQAVLESTRTAILTYFRERNFLHLLMKRPRSTMPDIKKGNSNMYGSPATVKVIDHYRELIYDFVLDYSYTIIFPEMISQLLRYTDHDKKKFDIIAAMGFCELGDEELSAKAPIEREETKKQFRDIGWFVDNNGYRHYGVIPTTEQEKYATTRFRREDSWLYKDSI